ncbi:MAG: elongation factor P maturation arginine rhamnosyltransferase EarP [Alphaproteobacteria bacterium]|nr:elongation factor P maturation arginine rhamnosyltransferase EarP [Alphaproteobacteria bacterium]MCB1550448.1 elongation factor P maturation arginine rhamnosyltransferase EarP [Alphaproteobacteria bacterium]MCB9985539.1 elongation factor P maturation arginine rhamnosyltransferase EarP [Micavibrio sp.]
MNFPRCVDIFCRVIDNFGDVGVCWRLARQLAVEDELAVRLFIDDPSSLTKIVPIPDPSVNVVVWDNALVYGEAADLVIEAFACDLPEQVLSVMKNRSIPPIWIDLEYLTAEDWALSCHAVPSLHPMMGVKKTLFFPGFDVTSGGLLREHDLIERRDLFQNDIVAQNKWRKCYNLPEFDSNCIDLSLFCYKSAPIEQIFDELSTYTCPVRVFHPVVSGFGVKKRGSLMIYRIPFVSQDQYDYLLWTCTANFVRGEDSFVRAQMAGRPMIWNIYVQEKGTHLVKMRAFLDLYLASFPLPLREVLAQSFELWNQEDQICEGVWKKFLDHLPKLDRQAQIWSDRLCCQSPLTVRLLEFYQNTKNNVLIKKDKL